MKLLQMAAACHWDRDEFSHTCLILQDNDNLFYVKSPLKYQSEADVDIRSLSPILIPPAHI